MENIKTPKISVIVPVYNAEKYLRRCVDSILAQSFTDFELLLVDDGSKDGSGAICDEYADRDNRVRVFHKENGGVSSARNLGLDNARGEWVAFCDADDYIEFQFLDEFHNLMTMGDLLCQGFHAIDWHHQAEEDIFEQDAVCKNKALVDYILHTYQTSQLGYVWSKAFKNVIIKRYHIRFDEQISLREDLVFVLDYCQYIQSISNSSKCLYQYKFSEQGKVFGSQDDFYVFKRIYTDINNIAEKYTDDKALLAAIKSLFVTTLFNNLICEKAPIKTQLGNIRYFVGEFGQYVDSCKDNTRTWRLFRKMYFFHNKLYLYVLILFMKILKIIF